MALSLTTAIKNKVAERCFSSTYALANATNQAIIDQEGASALLQLEDECQWFTATASTGNAPDSWEAYYVDEIANRVNLNAHPERAAVSMKQRDNSQLRAWEFYARNSIVYNPGSTTEAFVQTVQNNRNYIFSHCLRLKPALRPTPETVDAALWEILNSVWNKAGWGFKRRQVTYYLTRTAFTAATWTESTKTLTTTGVSTSLPTGARVYVTAGTSANQNEYTVASTTATTVVLNQSISATAGNLTDISFFYYTVNVVGLDAGETVDSIATWKLHLADGGEVCWADGDDLASLRAGETLATGSPTRFRLVQVAPSTLWPVFYPAPDDDYILSGEVLVSTPAAPTTASATTAFTKFDAAFGPAIRRAQLDRVLTNYDRHNEAMHAQVCDEIERLFPVYADPGVPDDASGPRDVYRDYDEMAPGGFMGGQI